MNKSTSAVIIISFICLIINFICVIINTITFFSQRQINAFCNLQ